MRWEAFFAVLTFDGRNGSSFGIHKKETIFLPISKDVARYGEEMKGRDSRQMLIKEELEIWLRHINF